jgi:hypothetical protein
MSPAHGLHRFRGARDGRVDFRGGGGSSSSSSRGIGFVTALIISEG